MAHPIVKYLAREEGFRVVGADLDPLAAGLFLADKAYKISPFAEREKFLGEVERIVQTEDVDVIIPTYDPLLLLMAQEATRFETLGARVLVSPAETLRAGEDKWQAYELLKGRVAMPKSFSRPEDVDIPFPVFLKPRRGSGSVDAYKINDAEELVFYARRVQDPIIQEYLEGEEYTVDCIADMQGNVLMVAPRIRLATKSGVSVKGRTVKNETLEEMARTLASILAFRGPFFFQAKEKNGVLMLTEINPRFGGGMPLTCGAGVNIYAICVRIFLGEQVQAPEPRWGMMFTRYEEEIFLTDEDISSRLFLP